MEQLGAVEANYREPGAPREEPKAPEVPRPPPTPWGFHKTLLFLPLLLCVVAGPLGAVMLVHALLVPFVLHAVITTTAIERLSRYRTMDHGSIMGVHALTLPVTWALAVHLSRP
jgi:hypothetical protein